MLFPPRRAEPQPESAFHSLHVTPHRFGSPFFFNTPSHSHRAAFIFLHSRVRHLLFICLCSVLSLLPSICVSPLALAPVSAQIHRAPSAPSRACRSTCPSRSAPNPPASPCRPSRTGERYGVDSETRLCVWRPDFPFHCSFEFEFAASGRWRGSRVDSAIWHLE